METDPECRGGGGPSTEAVDGEMRARAEGWATVRDPLSDVTIDITRQCVNVSLSGPAEVGPPSALPRARGSNTSSGCAWARQGQCHGIVCCRPPQPQLPQPQPQIPTAL